MVCHDSIGFSFVRGRHLSKMAAGASEKQIQLFPECLLGADRPGGSQSVEN